MINSENTESHAKIDSTEASKDSQPNQQFRSDPSTVNNSLDTSSAVSQSDSESKQILLAWWAFMTHFLNFCRRHGITVVLCSSGFGLFIPAVLKSVPLSIPPPQSVQRPALARIDYELLQIGITSTDAQAKIGRAIELSRDEETITYRWTYSDGSGITATFKNDRLVSKQQVGIATGYM